MRTAPGGWPILGRTDGSEMPAGFIGEYKTAVRPAGSPLSLVSGAAATVTNLPLQPGVWLVDGAVGFSPSATCTITLQSASLSQVDNAVPAQDDGNRTDVPTSSFAPGATLGARLPVRPRRINTAVPITTFLIAAAIFTSTMSTYGAMSAERVG